jgi:uncharacterized protein
MNVILFALFFAAATPSSDFLQAIRDQDATKVQSMLEANPSLAGAADEKGRTAVTLALFHIVNKESFIPPAKNQILQLILARHPTLDVWLTAAVGTPEQLSKMLKKDQINAKNEFGWTPLHYAGFAGNVANTKLLLDRGADMRIRATTKFRNSPFLAAMLIGDHDTIRLFLDRGADPLERQGEGDAALHEAAASGDMEMVKLLLERGSDVNARDDDGKSALDLAVERKHEEVAEYLRTKGAK